MSKEYTAGRVLRANGRYSLTHQWLRGSAELRTRCGLVYEAEELWGGNGDAPPFVAEASWDPTELRCSGCFEDGTARVLQA